MAGAKTGVATRMNEIKLHAHLTYSHGHALETIKEALLTQLLI